MHLPVGIQVKAAGGHRRTPHRQRIVSGKQDQLFQRPDETIIYWEVPRRGEADVAAHDRRDAEIHRVAARIGDILAAAVDHRGGVRHFRIVGYLDAKTQRKSVARTFQLEQRDVDRYCDDPFDGPAGFEIDLEPLRLVLRRATSRCGSRSARRRGGTSATGGPGVRAKARPGGTRFASARS